MKVEKVESGGRCEWSIFLEHIEVEDVTTDTDSNVVVVGRSLGSSRSPHGSIERDIWVGKYDRNGVELWTTTFDGGEDEGYGVATSTAGDVVVAGSVSGGAGFVREYDSRGNVLWTRIDPDGLTANLSVAVDRSGETTVTGFTTVRYDAAGNERWTREFEGKYYGIAFATDGNVVQSGYEFVGGVDKSESVVRKLDTNGAVLWVRTFQGPSTLGTTTPVAYVADDVAEGIAVDGSGNVIVVGRQNADASGVSEAWVRKLDPDGIALWNRERRVDDSCEEAVDVATRGDDPVVVGSSCVRSPTAWTALYDAEGVELETRTYSQLGRYVQARAVAVDADSNVLAVGTSSDGISTEVNSWVNKYCM